MPHRPQGAGSSWAMWTRALVTALPDQARGGIGVVGVAAGVAEGAEREPPATPVGAWGVAA